MGQDPDEQYVYNIIVKVTDISSQQELSHAKTELEQKGFAIYTEKKGSENVQAVAI